VVPGPVDILSYPAPEVYEASSYKLLRKLICTYASSVLDIVIQSVFTVHLFSELGYVLYLVITLTVLII
jgi:hypothetical protein